MTTSYTMYTVYKDAQGFAILFTDCNDMDHALFTWPGGGVTFQWETAYTGNIPYAGPIDPRLQKLVNSWLEYLDAVVEKE